MPEADRLFILKEQISTNSAMDAEELESADTHTLARTTISNSVSAPGENKKFISKRGHKSQSFRTRQYAVAQGRSNNAYLQQSVVEPVLHQALQVFLSNTVIPASGGSTFTGHFEKLVSLVQSSSRSEPLPFALEAVALASHANRFSSSEVQIEATRRYTLAIHRLRKMNLDSNSNVLGVIACILLLSLYEIINANMSSNLNWLRHLHGMIAFMKNLVERNQLPATGITMLVVGSEPPPNFDETNKFVSRNSSTIILQPTVFRFSDLWSLLPKARVLFQKSASLFEPASIRYESALKQLRDEAISLKSELMIWFVGQPEMARAETIERFTQQYTLRFPGVEDLVCPTTRADIYSDYFVGCMWNTYRQCQLHITNLLNRINHSLSKDPEAYNNSREHAKLRNEIRTYIDDLCASIPFMLVGAGIYGNKPVGPIWFQAQPPRLIGGLSLQWVLFTASILDITSVNEKRNMKTLLLWIGKNLGIKQATVLAHTERNPPGCITAKGDALRWTGFLI